MSAKYRPPIERLLDMIDQRGPDDCWLWTGSIGTWGYGSFYLHGKNLNASRAAYLLLVGEIGEKLVVCHSCDTPACCNPAHLWLGTQGQNVRDCNQKGRARGQYSELQGALHPRHTAKLTAEDIGPICALHMDRISNCAIARLYGVDNTTIRSVVVGRTWLHVPRPEGFQYRPFSL